MTLSVTSVGSLGVLHLLRSCAGKFVHYESKDIPSFVSDFVTCGKWQSTLGNVSHQKPLPESESSFLFKLSEE
jgi:hypothetical protein